MIRKIKWKNHKILGNLELNFTRSDDGIYNTIVLAGENGSGKTIILESISKYLTMETSQNVEYWEYETPSGNFKISPLDGKNLCFHHRINLNTNITQNIQTSRNNNFYILKEDKSDIRSYGCLYSKSRSGFNTRPVKSTTTEKLDSNKYDSDSNEDFTSIKQLIIDVYTQDTDDYYQENSNGKSMSMHDFQKKSKISRFKKAFSNFFNGTIEFSKIDRSSTNEMQILFEKHGKSITIDELSTGEKQIIFRGSMLLKNSNAMENGCILIDEPELSMHPSWQSKILDYYRDLFRDTSNRQTVQMIFATHSEYVIRSAMKERNNVLVIVLQNNGTDIIANKIDVPQILPIITAAETNYIAFKIASSDYHILLYGYLQEKTGCTSSIKNCDNYIIRQPEYDPNKHKKTYIYKNTTYESLPTYIRNAIDHPDNQHNFSENELIISIELLQKLCIAVEFHEEVS